MQIAEGSHELEAILNRADADITKKGNIIVTFKSKEHLLGGILEDDWTADLEVARRKAEDLMKLFKNGQDRYTQCMLFIQRGERQFSDRKTPTSQISDKNYYQQFSDKN